MDKLTDNQQAQIHCKNLAKLLYNGWIISGKPKDPDGVVKHVRILIAGALDRCIRILIGKDDQEEKK